MHGRTHAFGSQDFFTLGVGHTELTVWRIPPPPLRSHCGLGASRIHRCKDETRSEVHESGAAPPLPTSRHVLSMPQRIAQTSLCCPVNNLSPPFSSFFWPSSDCPHVQNLATQQPLHLSIGASSPHFCPHPRPTVAHTHRTSCAHVAHTES